MVLDKEKRKNELLKLKMITEVKEELFCQSQNMTQQQLGHKFKKFKRIKKKKILVVTNLT
jgi:hypothetical protein